MTKEEIVGLLVKDLKNEYTHMLFYVHASSMIQSLHREELSEFFTKQAQSEMKHVQAFSRMILGLGGHPVPNYYQWDHLLTKPSDMLKVAIDLEKEVVENYSTRIDQANGLGGSDGKFIQIFLEDQLLDSKQDLDNMQQMLMGMCSGRKT